MRAVEQLASESPTIQIGGIYALERVAQESRVDREMIVSLLCSFVRPTPAEQREWENSTPDGMPDFEDVGHADVVKRAAAEVVARGRGGWPPALIDLSGAFLTHSNFVGGSLCQANLSEANLMFCNFQSADLRWAELNGRTHLGMANFSYANLTGAVLAGANATHVTFDHADLTGANLQSADLSCASFRNADLSGANLMSAELFDVDLGTARIDGAVLQDADLTRAHLTANQREYAQSQGAKLASSGSDPDDSHG
ncbi:pentapeptide repeat-containing protein [Yimella sp. cx-51]|uniref:pentapeptide repeat-containing protein n=1 Tax=Yimella sp. cx-51 TaxID=2770551 RepID=UPI00165D5F5F|nr:pentapeptide repeat-containing protein [Yimella sp. cx-51]MBC9958339.1 pentapeptide repeat-containing protein [Yimella sp. cx-51]QTH39758.1 pentapeptide repeat-containing protein [Yimella sp. cx-51]